MPVRAEMVEQNPALLGVRYWVASPGVRHKLHTSYVCLGDSTCFSGKVLLNILISAKMKEVPSAKSLFYLLLLRCRNNKEVLNNTNRQDSCRPETLCRAAILLVYIA